MKEGKIDKKSKRGRRGKMRGKRGKKREKRGRMITKKINCFVISLLCCATPKKSNTGVFKKKNYRTRELSKKRQTNSEKSESSPRRRWGGGREKVRE